MSVHCRKESIWSRPRLHRSSVIQNLMLACSSSIIQYIYIHILVLEESCVFQSAFTSVQSQIYWVYLHTPGHRTAIMSMQTASIATYPTGPIHLSVTLLCPPRVFAPRWVDFCTLQCASDIMPGIKLCQIHGHSILMLLFCVR